MRIHDNGCTLKAYRSEALRQMKLTDPGYAMPLELWVEAAAAGLRVIEGVTGEDLRVDPFVTYLRAKLEDAGLLAPA